MNTPITGKLSGRPLDHLDPVTADEIALVVHTVVVNPTTTVHGPVVTRERGGVAGAVYCETAEPCRFYVPDPALPPALRDFTVPAGFRFERATVPLLLRAVGGLVGFDRDHLIPAALGHDYARSKRSEWGLTDEDCDRLFRRIALAEPHLPDWQAEASHRFVRANSLATGTPAGRAALAVASHALRGLLRRSPFAPFLPRR